MRDRLNLLVDELKHLKRIGVTAVYCEDSTIEILRARVESLKTAEDLVEVQESISVEALISEANTKKIVKNEPPGIILEAPVARTPNVGKTKKSKDITMLEHASFELPFGDKQTQWNWLRDRVLSCPECNKHLKPGKKVVFGAGNLDADIFFCGEAPGADEEIQGKPFAGKAGQLLTKIINVMGLQRSDVYIGNIMNWRPEMPTAYGNRPPTQKEMEFCLPYIKAQLEIIKPKVIVALGATAVNGLMGVDSKRRMSHVRGRWFSFQKIPLMITFHPSYLLRNGTMKTKKMVWEDMLQVMKKVDMEITEKQKAYFQQLKTS